MPFKIRLDASAFKEAPMYRGVPNGFNHALHGQSRIQHHGRDL